LIVDKSIDPSEMLVMDQNAVLLAARRLAYGDTYRVKITCPRCSNENTADIDLSKIEEKEVDLRKFPRGVNRFEYQLPYSKKTLVIRALIQKDVDSIEAEMKNLQKVNKDETAEVTTRLRRLIISIDGNEDKNVIRRFVDREMLARDAVSLRKFLADTLPSLDTGFDFECVNCAYTERMDVPFTVQFFWPESGR
jgi:hypothetical protein